MHALNRIATRATAHQKISPKTINVKLLYCAGVALINRAVYSFEHNKYVTIDTMWKIEYSCKDIEKFILSLPPGLGARYVRLSELMMEFGANLGMPHTRAMSDGLFELRIKGKEGIARVFYCTQVEERIVMLHGFVKKSQKTPQKELRIARHRLLEVKSREP